MKIKKFRDKYAREKGYEDFNDLLFHNSLMPKKVNKYLNEVCLLYTSPSPRDATLSRMPSSA